MDRKYQLALCCFSVCLMAADLWKGCLCVIDSPEMSLSRLTTHLFKVALHINFVQSLTCLCYCIFLYIVLYFITTSFQNSLCFTHFLMLYLISLLFCIVTFYYLGYNILSCYYIGCILPVLYLCASKIILLFYLLKLLFIIKSFLLFLIQMLMEELQKTMQDMMERQKCHLSQHVNQVCGVRKRQVVKCM